MYEDNFLKKGHFSQIIILLKWKVKIVSEYYVTNSIDMIDEYCADPTKYKSRQLSEAINDAHTHYVNGLVSKAWYDTVVRILSQYI